MALPKYNELYQPVLSILSDGKVWPIRKVWEKAGELLRISPEEMAMTLPSGGMGVFVNRIGWARTYLKKAGLIDSPKRGFVQITEEGRKALEEGVEITNSYLMRYPSFAEFQNRTVPQDKPEEVQEVSETPQETLDRVYKTINSELAEELLSEIMRQSPGFFETLVVDLMKAMGYGDGFVTKASGDDGIDGIIHEDKLGFNLIYIQAKRWNPSVSIGKPEIQKFAGAMMGPPKIEKGLFITTARFSQGARAYGEAQHIILVDGQKLTELMIEYGLGVTTQKTYLIKRVDSDYFAEE
ncbi:MAG TPA: restriction endonuclease [Candidatus Acutalibacter pullistercoris]|uniref:Restriction endonuclease n=1 Tax=Candidatus Acutalibacter pullistercoris TaxID=2838418 RepID=A0A9D1YC43_9FIRM|nr:restriction endonuclease [Candidatus Acutalibacter pullistercoris]